VTKECGLKQRKEGKTKKKHVNGAMFLTESHSLSLIFPGDLTQGQVLSLLHRVRINSLPVSLLLPCHTISTVATNPTVNMTIVCLHCGKSRLLAVSAPSCARGTYRKNGHMIFRALMKVLKGRELVLERSWPYSVLKALRVLMWYFSRLPG
jgi:hypothetical protein